MFIQGMSFNIVSFSEKQLHNVMSDSAQAVNGIAAQKEVCMFMTVNLWWQDTEILYRIVSIMPAEHYASFLGMSCWHNFY